MNDRQGRPCVARFELERVIAQSYLGRREGSAQSMLAQISRGGSTRPATLPVSVRNCVRGPPLAEPDQARRTLQEPVGDRGGHHGVAEHLAPLAVAGPLVGIGGVPVVTGPILKMWLPNELEQLGTAFSTACPPPLCCLGRSRPWTARGKRSPVPSAPCTWPRHTKSATLDQSITGCAFFTPVSRGDTGMTRKRCRFSADFKRRVALEALWERDTVQAIAAIGCATTSTSRGACPSVRAAPRPPARRSSDGASSVPACAGASTARTPSFGCVVRT